MILLGIVSTRQKCELCKMKKSTKCLDGYRPFHKSLLFPFKLASLNSSGSKMLLNYQLTNEVS